MSKVTWCKPFPRVETPTSAVRRHFWCDDVTSCLPPDAVSFPSVKRKLQEPCVCTETIKHEVQTWVARLFSPKPCGKIAFLCWRPAGWRKTLKLWIFLTSRILVELDESASVLTSESIRSRQPFSGRLVEISVSELTFHVGTKITGNKKIKPL